MSVPMSALDDHAPRWQPLPPTKDSTVAVAASAFLEYLMRQGMGSNSLAAFAADLRLFTAAVEPGTLVSQFGSEHVSQFRRYLLEERPVRCSPRSLRRRLTVLEAFWRFLAAAGLVEALPAAAFEPSAGPSSPPPLLTEAEMDRLVEASRQMLAEGEARALLLASLIISAGLTKSECLALRRDDLDLKNGLVRVGHGQRRRVLPLAPEARQAAAACLEHAGDGAIFNCTGRNLEYILARAGARAGLDRKPTFRLLRASAAAAMLRTVGPEAVVRRLGISPATWPAMRRRLSPEMPTAPTAH